MKFPVLDLETTGLTIKPGAIVEVSVVIMDTDFVVHEEFTRAVKHTPETLEPLLNPWAKKTHTESGLLQECYETGTTLYQIETEVLNLLNRHFVGTDRPVLVGSSIHWDRRWIAEYMLALDNRLHYRMLDVSGLWEWLRMFHNVEKPDLGPVHHRGIPDTRGSAKLLKIFGERVEVGPAQAAVDSNLKNLGR